MQVRQSLALMDLTVFGAIRKNSNVPVYKELCVLLKNHILTHVWTFVFYVYVCVCVFFWIGNEDSSSSIYKARTVFQGPSPSGDFAYVTHVHCGWRTDKGLQTTFYIALTVFVKMWFKNSKLMLMWWFLWAYCPTYCNCKSYYSELF